MTTISDERLADAEWLEQAARYFEKRDTGGEDMAFWANVANAERCRSIAQSLRAQGGVSRFVEVGEFIASSEHGVGVKWGDLGPLGTGDKIYALSSLEASPAPVSEEMVEVVAHAISRLIPLDGGSKWLEPYGHDFPKDYSPSEQFMIRQIAAAALAAKGGQ